MSSCTGYKNDLQQQKLFFATLKVVKRFSQQCFPVCETSCWNGVTHCTLCNDSCNLSRNGVSPFAIQGAGMVLHCGMILATCFAAATAEDSRESIVLLVID